MGTLFAEETAALRIARRPRAPRTAPSETAEQFNLFAERRAEPTPAPPQLPPPPCRQATEPPRPVAVRPIAAPVPIPAAAPDPATARLPRASRSRFVVQAFRSGPRGTLLPDPAIVAASAAAAVMRAERMAGSKAGVIVYATDPEEGDAGEPVILARHGQVPESD